MISINLTIHNKDFLLQRVLDGIKDNTHQRYELVCVLDGCDDNSEKILDEFVRKNKNLSVQKLFAPNVFETQSNNLAAKHSTGDFLIIVQDDMVITEKGWDKRILKPFYVFDDIFAVTARTAHNWEENKNSIHLHEEIDRDDQWCDIINHVDHAQAKNLDRETFAVRDCVNRGPLAIRRDIFERMNGFDELFSPQDMDDHDFCYRTFKATGLRCGCYPVGFLSEDSWGGTRASGRTASWHLKANQKNTKILWERHKNLIINGPIGNENRKLT